MSRIVALTRSKAVVARRLVMVIFVAYVIFVRHEVSLRHAAFFNVPNAGGQAFQPPVRDQVKKYYQLLNENQLSRYRFAMH